MILTNSQISSIIIGNSRFSKVLMTKKGFNGIEFISLRDIISGKNPLELTYRKIYFISQVTRRIINNKDILTINRQVTEFVLAHSDEYTEVVYISSIDVFGSNQNIINSKLGRSPFDYYSQSKVETENAIEKEINKSLIIRFPGMYGYDLEEGSIISRMVKSIITEKKIILTSANIKRSILSYQHAVNYLIESSKQLSKNAEGNYFGILGSKESLSLDKIACILLRRTDLFGNSINKIIDSSNDTSNGRSMENYIEQSDLDIIRYKEETIESGVKLFLDKLAKDGTIK